MGQSEPSDAELLAILEVMAVESIGPTLAQHACVAPPLAIMEALQVAGIDIMVRRLLAPDVPKADADVQLPDTPGRRYSVRANPKAAGDGAMATVSFRIPKAVKTLFEERVAELADDETEPGIENQTDAGQDAIVRWLLMEGK